MRRLRAAALSEVELAMDIINQAKAHLRAQGIDQLEGRTGGAPAPGRVG